MIQNPQHDARKAARMAAKELNQDFNPKGLVKLAEDIEAAPPVADPTLTHKQATTIRSLMILDDADELLRYIKLLMLGAELRGRREELRWLRDAKANHAPVVPTCEAMSVLPERVHNAEAVSTVLPGGAVICAKCGEEMEYGEGANEPENNAVWPRGWRCGCGHCIPDDADPFEE